MAYDIQILRPPEVTDWSVVMNAPVLRVYIGGKADVDWVWEAAFDLVADQEGPHLLDGLGSTWLENEDEQTEAEFVNLTPAGNVKDALTWLAGHLIAINQKADEIQTKSQEANGASKVWWKSHTEEREKFGGNP